MRLRCDPSCHRMVRVDRKRCRFLHCRRVRIRMDEHESRKTKGERRLADSWRPADQPCMRNAAALVGIEQCTLSLFMTEQRRGFTGQLADPVI